MVGIPFDHSSLLRNVNKTTSGVHCVPVLIIVQYLSSSRSRLTGPKFCSKAEYAENYGEVTILNHICGS